MLGLLVQMPVGLNSGEVVVRAIGNDLHMDYAAVGQTTCRAARMEQLATLRLLDDIAAHCDPPEVIQTEAYYQRALDLAEELGTRPLQAPCHHRLGTLYAQLGRQQSPAAPTTSTNLTVPSRSILLLAHPRPCQIVSEIG